MCLASQLTCEVMVSVTNLRQCLDCTLGQTWPWRCWRLQGISAGDFWESVTRWAASWCSTLPWQIVLPSKDWCWSIPPCSRKKDMLIMCRLILTCPTSHRDDSMTSRRQSTCLSDCEVEDRTVCGATRAWQTTALMACCLRLTRLAERMVRVGAWPVHLSSRPPCMRVAPSPATGLGTRSSTFPLQSCAPSSTVHRLAHRTST
mmetsp:Transcript_65126/g.172513  ORF Transcript_65126/g.172513 Transcript_65126/m.172513 type:complete len:203 (-) Transcript_65126:468-1076(-)